MSLTEEEQRLAQPDTDHDMEAWYMDDDTTADQRLPHRREPNEPASLAVLTELGVLSWRMGEAAADAFETDPRLKAIRKARGYSYHDVITVSPDKLPGYEQKIKSFYEEHIHDDEEVRYILDGNGYFDVRDLQDRWVRIKLGKGDMIVLPAGIYHRFTMDDTNYAKALRLFVGDPVWTPHNRPQEERPARVDYVQRFGVKVH